MRCSFVSGSFLFPVSQSTCNRDSNLPSDALMLVFSCENKLRNDRVKKEVSRWLCLWRIFQLLFLCMWISVSVWDFEFCVYSFRVRPAARGPDELLVSKMRKSFSSVCVFPWTKRSGWLVGWLLFKCVVVCGRFVVCWLVCRHKCAEFWLRKIRSFAYIDMVGRECVYFFFYQFLCFKGRLHEIRFGV